jgi:hypothetical protein
VNIDLKEKAMDRTISEETRLSKREKRASTYRRVVTGTVNGRSIVQTDEEMERKDE